MHYSGSPEVHWAGWWMLSQNLKEKDWFLCPPPFSKLKCISGSPVGRNTKFRATIAQGQTHSSLNRKLPNNLNPLWGSSRDDCGQSGRIPVISTRPKTKWVLLATLILWKVTQIMIFTTISLQHSHSISQLQHRSTGKGMKFFHNSEIL